MTDKILLKSNNKTYSLESINIEYETKMTSNTTPAPLVASASSQIGVEYPAWKAFNGTFLNNQDCWHSNATTNGWLQLDFGNKKSISYFILKGRPTANPEASPNTFSLLGSNDGISYDVLFSISNVTWVVGEEKTFQLPRVAKYRFYKLDIIKPTTGLYIIVGKLQFGYKDNILNNLPATNKDNFIDYGQSTLNTLGTIMSNKNYILQDAVSETLDGLWTVQLNRKPLSIRF